MNMNAAPPPAGGFGGREPGGYAVPPHAFGPIMVPSPGSSTSYATATLIVGIISILGLFVCLMGLPFAFGAIGMGMHSLKQTRRHPDLFGGRKRAIAGLVLGIISMALAIVFVAIALFAL